MPTKHPQHDKIIEGVAILTAIAEGRDAQFRYVGCGTWLDWKQADGVPPVFDGDDWRVKPETLRYRVAVMRYSDGRPYALVVDQQGSADIVTDYSNFVRWATDWQEVEVSK